MASVGNNIGDAQIDLLRQFMSTVGQQDFLGDISGQAQQGLSFLLSAPADATAVEQFPDVQLRLEQGLPGVDPGFDIRPGRFDVENPKFLDQSEGDQRRARMITSLFGHKVALEQGLEPESFPSGNIQGAVRGFAAGLGMDVEPAHDVSLPVSIASGLAGETAKFGALLALTRGAGLGPGLSGAAAGAVSGALREEADLESVALESVLAGAGEALLPSAKAVAGVKPVKGQAAQVRPPLTESESVSLSFFGYTPEAERSLQRAWAGVVDKAAEKVLTVVPERIKTGVRHVTTGSAPPEARVIIKQAERAKRFGSIEAKAIGQSIRENVAPENQLDAFKWLDPTAFEGTGQIADDVLPILQKARSKIDALGAEWVEVGLGEQEVYLKNVGSYLTRSYQKHELKDAVSDMFRSFRKHQIKGRQAKRRTLKTIEQREKAGLITDPAYAVSRTVADLTFDIETAKMFRKIARNPTWITDVETPGFAQVPNSPRYGDLAGKYLNKGIHDEIMQIMPARDPNAFKSEMINLYDRLLASWKFGKTALNPATQGRNFFSNTILADLGGLSPIRVDVYAKALRDLWKRGPFYREAEPLGLFGTDWFGSEIKQYISPMKGTRGGSMLDRSWQLAAESPIGKGIGKAGDLYQGVEHWSKLALYTHVRKQGLTPEQAVAHAQKYLFDYSDISPALKKLKRSPFGGPFLTFTAKALPLIGEAAIKNPFRVGKYYLGFEIMNNYAKSALGISDDEYDRLKRSLPPWQRSGWQILLPFRDKTGKPLLFDLTYNLPWGDIAEQGVLTKNIPVVGDIPLISVAERFFGGNPFLRLPAEQLLNVDPFRERPIFDPALDPNLRGQFAGLPIPPDAGGQATEKSLRKAFEQLAPGIVTAIPKVIDPFVGGKTKAGEEIDPLIRTIDKLLGVRVRPVDIERGLDISRSKLLKEIRTIRSRLIGLKFDKSLSKEERKTKTKELRKQLKRIQKEMRGLK